MIALAPGNPRLWSADAESSVLGGMLIDHGAAKLAVDLLRDEDFHQPAHRTLFHAMREIMERGERVDVVTLTDHLRNAGDLQSTGGAAYLAQLMDSVPTAANLEYHAGRVQRLSALRALLGASRQIAAVVADAGNMEAEDVYAQAERILSSAAPAVRGDPPTPVKSRLWPVMERLEALGTEREEPRIRCGLRDVDGLTGGFRKGTMVVIAGRPSMGKSALGLCNLVAHAAIEEKRVCVVFSAEDTKDDVVSRMLASTARVDLAKARSRRGLRPDELPRLGQAVGLLNTAPIYIEDQAYTIEEIRSRLRQVVREQGRVDVVAVDYLQLLKAKQYDANRVQEVSFISRELKRIAKEFSCLMVALSQLSRKVEDRPDKRPMMSDLRESGQLEQDADAILLLFRPEYYFGATMKVGKGKEAREENVEGKAEVIVGKMRDGATGAAHVAFRKEFTLFEDLGHA